MSPIHYNLDATVIARRVIEAAESGSCEALAGQLSETELLVGHPEERLELLGAIAHDMRVRLALHDSLKPHLDLLRHLSREREWVN